MPDAPAPRQYRERNQVRNQNAVQPEQRMDAAREAVERPGWYLDKYPDPFVIVAETHQRADEKE